MRGERTTTPPSTPKMLRPFGVPGVLAVPLIAGAGLQACFMDGYAMLDAGAARDAARPDGSAGGLDATLADAGRYDPGSDASPPNWNAAFDCEASVCLPTRACSDPCEPPCELFEPCAQRCVGDLTCANNCTANRHCVHDCAGTSNCGTICNQGALCEVDCTAAGHCNVTCQAGSSCSVRCRYHDQCTVRCEPGAECHLACLDTPANCSFASCSSVVSQCAQGVMCGSFGCSAI